MSIYVNTNVSSLNAQRQLFSSSLGLNTAFERLSSGMRINSAKDDAAGLQIVDRMTSQIQGLDQAIRNANDGISLAQVAEGAMTEITNSLQRIRVLSIQSQNGINSTTERNALDLEAQALIEEISRIAATSEFAGVNILRGGFSSAFLVGAAAGQTISINLSRTDGYGSEGLLGSGLISLTTVAGAASALAVIDGAISAVNSTRAELGAIQNRFESTIRNLANISENVSAARSRIRDTDFAAETASLTQWQIIQQASTSILAQANQRPQAALQLLQ
jgi:flagellin